jgi:hypothetical protein
VKEPEYLGGQNIANEEPTLGVFFPQTCCSISSLRGKE